MDASQALVNQVSADAVFFHAHPEIGWQERQTSSYITSRLGPPLWQAKTALVYAVGSGPAVFFRAELDALNTRLGIRHVCGHSTHLAALLGAYRYFHSHPPPHHTIYFVFQPCEEGYPSGAKYINDHFPPLRKCRAAIAFHAHPSKIPGEIINPHMAACDYFELEIIGVGTHIKNKYSTKLQDCALAAAQLVSRINTSVFDQALINIGVSTAGETPNSIAGRALLRGDVRALSEPARLRVISWLSKQTVKFKQDFSRLSLKLHYFSGYPLLQNDPVLLGRCQKLFPITPVLKTYGTEDFSLYTAPKLFFHIGTGLSTELHETNFIVPAKVRLSLLNYWIIIGKNLQLLCH